MRVLRSLLLLFLVLLFVSPNAFSEDEFDLYDCLRHRAEVYRILERKYVWGDWDCSAFIHRILTDCGVSVLRCRSSDYAEGRCGLDSDVVKLIESCDFTFFTFPSKKIRKNGHIGMAKNKDQVYHNSTGRRRVVLDKMTADSYLKKHLSRIRRLNPDRGK
jgi:hypothetical protein